MQDAAVLAADRLGQDVGMSKSTSRAVVRMLASRSVPMPTTARWNWSTPSCLVTSGSATTAWVSSCACCWTILGFESMQRTSVPHGEQHPHRLATCAQRSQHRATTPMPSPLGENHGRQERDPETSEHDVQAPATTQFACAPGTGSSRVSRNSSTTLHATSRFRSGVPAIRAAKSTEGHDDTRSHHESTTPADCRCTRRFRCMASGTLRGTCGLVTRREAVMVRWFDGSHVLGRTAATTPPSRRRRSARP